MSMNLLERNTEEILREQKIDEALEGENPRAYVGYETSGPVHLGHWMSIRKLLDAEEAGFEPVVLLADKHTFLNKKGESDWTDNKLKEWIDEMGDYWQAVFEPLGLEDAEFIRGREFQDTVQYQNDVLDMGTKVTENRAKRAMGDIADEDNVYVAQTIYPLMQSLDMPYLDIDLAIGGMEQKKIHALAIDKLPEVGYEAPSIMHYPLVSSLKGKGEKMSSSKPETMFPLHASEETIEDRIQGAYCPPGEVEENPIFQIAEYLILGADEELVIEIPQKYGGETKIYENLENLEQDYSTADLHPADLKKGVAENIIEKLEPVRDRFKGEESRLNPLTEIGHELPDYTDK